MSHSTDVPDPTPVHLDMIAAAERSLGARLRFESVVVDYPESPSLILRCGVLPGSGELPETVVVKHPRQRSGTLFDEWGSLDFLNQLEETRKFVPTLLRVDVKGELSVMEDLGESKPRQLGWILEGEDPALAERGLLAFARTLGRVQGVASGREGKFRECRGRYPVGGVSRHRVHRIAEALEVLPDHLNSIGIGLDSGARGEIQDAQDDLGDPGAFTTWSHGDWTPANAFYDPSRNEETVRFFDLETGGWRHALLDGVYPRLRYIHSVWAKRIPGDLQRRTDDVYREELVRGIPEAEEEITYSRARLVAAAGWMAGLLCFLPEVLEKDSKWGRSTRRQRIVAALEHFDSLASELQGFPVLSRVSRDAAAALRNIWPESDCTMRLHKAFAGRG